MKQCDYKFLLGNKKGQLCNKNCRESRCGNHSIEQMEKRRDNNRRKREDPEFQEKERLQMAKRRADPIYKAKELEYMKRYCEKNTMTMDELWLGINTK
jgi:hypothetical protein